MIQRNNIPNNFYLDQVELSCFLAWINNHLDIVFASGICLLPYFQWPNLLVVGYCILISVITRSGTEFIPVYDVMKNLGVQSHGLPKSVLNISALFRTFYHRLIVLLSY